MSGVEQFENSILETKPNAIMIIKIMIIKIILFFK